MSKRKRDEAEEVDDGGSDSEAELIEELIASGAYKQSAEQNAGVARLVNNKDGLRQALDSFRQSDLPWIERLEVVSAEPAAIKNVNDDMQVELAFYGQALAAVTAARGEFERLGVPHRRPDDYFAEMLKSDTHMRKVKDKLILEKQKITSVEHRRKEKDSAAFNKQAAVEKTREKALEKRTAERAISSWRKKGKEGGRPDLETDADLEKLFENKRAPAEGSRGGGGRGDRATQVARFKREGKDKKYGHGGKKRGEFKMNSKDSATGAASMKDFSVKKMKGSLPPGMRQKGGKGAGSKGKPRSGPKKNAGANRPSKRARMSR